MSFIIIDLIAIIITPINRKYYLKLRLKSSPSSKRTSSAVDFGHSYQSWVVKHIES